MSAEYGTVIAHLLAALLAGGIIGLERSFHARPAGFRTHTLVCLTSAMLMLVTLFEWRWIPGNPLDTVRTDPTRMAQGIMTGIGFLGAGVIFKEGFSVRGLTTAASIWVTAAIGILIGIGFYFAAALATALALGVLSLFRRIEAWMPSQSYAHHYLRFDRNNVLSEADVRKIMADHGFNVANMSYKITDDGRDFEYRMILSTRDVRQITMLAAYLLDLKQVKTFRLSPTGD